MTSATAYASLLSKVTKNNSYFLIYLCLFSNKVYYYSTCLFIKYFCCIFAT